MSDQDGKQAPALLPPSTEDTQAWKAYWQAQGQPWRTEPEIDTKRQDDLAKRRRIPPNMKQCIYPFKDIEPKLTRADVEWLLATHENGRGPVDWQDERQREREGLDLRGADLRQVNLSGLPLARMRGGLTEVWFAAPEEQRNMAAVCMEQANLTGAQLQGASLMAAQLQGASLMAAQLQGASLMAAQLQGANLREAQLQEANLIGAELQEASLRGAELQEANLWRAQLQEADLMAAQLQEANLIGAQLQGAHLEGVQLQEADLRRSALDAATLDGVKLSDETDGSVRLADVRWGDVNLAVVDWGHVLRLGDESVAREKRDSTGTIKEKQTRVSEYKEAVRANRQLAVALQGQGLNEEAARFAYHAQALQKSVLWYQMTTIERGVFKQRMTQQRVSLRQRMQTLGAWLFSWFLFLLAGYGYRPGRSVLWYLATIIVFALGYHVFGHLSLWPPDAFVYSLTSFHGRGFFPGLEGKHSLHDPLIMFAAVEAVVGLVIEISFIATFTQRFFGK